MNPRRLSALTALARKADLDAVALAPGPNLFYVTGLAMGMSERPALAFFAPDHDLVMVAPKLEALAIASHDSSIRIFDYDDTTGPGAAFEGALEAMNLKGRKLGIEGKRLRYFEACWMHNSKHAPTLVDAHDALNPLRARKDEREIQQIRRAISIAQEAMVNTLNHVRGGVSENALCAHLLTNLLNAGSSGGSPFPPIVATGVGADKPHAHPSERLMHDGDLVTVDWGATHEHYHADLTRVYAVGRAAKPHPQLVEAYKAVQEANHAGREAVRPGVTAGDVDEAARRVIEKAGFGPYFNHRLGHGLGLEVHEAPDIKTGSNVILEEGMVFTVEPGIYLPGVGGIRIEDNVVVTPRGSQTLSSLPRELTRIGA